MGLRSGKKSQQQPTAESYEDSMARAVKAALGPIVDATAANTTGINQLRESRRTEVKARRAGDQRNHEDIQKLDKRHRNLQSRTDRHQARQDNNIAALDQRLAETHDLVVQLTQVVGGDPSALQQAFKASRTGDRKSFIEELRRRNVSDDDIARVLVILLDKGKELNLSDAELFAELYGAFGSLRRIVTEHTEDITVLKSDVKELKRAVGGTVKWLVPLIIGGVVGLIAGLLWWWHDFTGVVEIPPAPFKDSLGGQGTIDFTNGVAQAPADDWWAAVMFGFAIGGIAFGVAWIIMNLWTKSTDDKQVNGTANAKPQSPKPSGPNTTGNGTNGGFINGQLAAQNPNHPKSQAQASGGGAPTRVNILTQPGVSAPAGPATKKA